MIQSGNPRAISGEHGTSLTSQKAELRTDLGRRQKDWRERKEAERIGTTSSEYYFSLIKTATE